MKVAVNAPVGHITPGGDAALLLLEKALAPEAELALKATPFTHRCAELWIAHHARRFGCYKKRSAAARGSGVSPALALSTLADMARHSERAAAAGAKRIRSSFSARDREPEG